MRLDSRFLNALVSILLLGTLTACKNGVIVESSIETDETPDTDPPAVDSFSLSLTIIGDGSVSDGNNQCTDSCSLVYPADSNVSLTTTPSNGASVAWSGACTGSDTCNLDMSQDRSATVTFSTPQTSTSHTLNVIPASNGTITGTGINCGSDCAEDLIEGAQLSLTASPSSGYNFARWTGACSGTSTTCNLTMDTDKTVSAQFSPTQVVDNSDCNLASVHCVDATGSREYTNIEAAISAANSTDTIMVFAGTYAGFNVTKSGNSASQPLTIKAAEAGVILNRRGSASDSIIRITNASYITIDGFRVTNSDGTSLGVAARGANGNNPMRGLTISNNDVSGFPTTNMYFSQVSESLIENNAAYNSSAGHGIYLANGGSDNTILRGNQTYQNGVNGIHFNGDATVSGDGLHTGLIIEGNRIYDNVANGLDMDGVKDSLLQNNLIFDNGRNAIRAFKVDSIEGTGGLTIINNTCVDNGGWAIKLTDDDGDNVIFNNILLDDSGSISVNSANLATGYNITNNIFRVSPNSEGSTVNLSSWQSFGYGENSMVSSKNGLFNNIANNDYSLSQSGDATDSGTNSFNGSSAPLSDIEGSNRPKGASADIGAYESF